jgi:hypothetical protein
MQAISVVSFDLAKNVFQVTRSTRRAKLLPDHPLFSSGGMLAGSGGWGGLEASTVHSLAAEMRGLSEPAFRAQFGSEEQRRGGTVGDALGARLDL